MNGGIDLLIRYRLYVAWTSSPMVEIGFCILWLLVRSPVVEIPVYTGDET